MAVGRDTPSSSIASVLEFHHEVDGRTRLEIRQWLPEHLTGPSEEGRLEAFTKLDAMLKGARAGSAPVVEV